MVCLFVLCCVGLLCMYVCILHGTALHGMQSDVTQTFRRSASFFPFERERGGGGRRQRTPHVRFRNAFLKLCRRCYCFRMKDTRDTNQKTTLNNGYLGSRIDEERSEMRYVV